MKILNLNSLSPSEWKIKYNSYVNLQPNEEEKIFALQSIINFLESLDCDYFVSGGTCLGIIRDGKLITWDDDVDIDIIDESYDKNCQLIINFAHTNKYPYKRGNNLFHPKINIFINNVKVSIGKLSKGKFNSKTLFRPKTKIPLDIISPCQSHYFNGMKLRIPSNPRAYLSFIYGESWVKPIKWNGTDQYRSKYERKGFLYSILDRVQIFLSLYNFQKYKNH